MKEFIPEGHEKFERRADELDQARGERGPVEWLRNPKTRVEFKLTNRSFKEIDKTFNLLLSKTIETFLKTRPVNEQIRILDIGGGIDSKAANEISERYSGQQSRISIINLDLTARGDTRENVHRIIGDISPIPLKNHVPLEDESVDIAYSRRTIAAMAEIEADQEKLRRDISEVARILKPGGIAFIDETELSSLPSSYAALAELSKTLSVKFFAKPSGTKSTMLHRLIANFRKKYGDISFLVMVKEPIDPLLLKSLDLE